MCDVCDCHSLPLSFLFRKEAELYFEKAREHGHGAAISGRDAFQFVASTTAGLSTILGVKESRVKQPLESDNAKL